MPEKNPKPIKVDRDTYRLLLKVFGPNNGYEPKIIDKKEKEDE